MSRILEWWGEGDDGSDEAPDDGPRRRLRPRHRGPHDEGTAPLGAAPHPPSRQPPLDHIHQGNCSLLTLEGFLLETTSEPTPKPGFGNALFNKVGLEGAMGDSTQQLKNILAGNI